MIRLIFHSGPQAGTEINTAAPVVRLGRDPAQNDLIVEDPMTSGRHAVIRRTPRGVYQLEDLGSTNGTFINGERVQTVFLSSGDRFGIGATEIEVSEGQARLMFVGGPRAGKEVPLGEQEVTIGRSPDNSLELTDADVSGYHSVIKAEPLGFVLEDRGSSNGTWVNGERVNAKLLQDGDTITVGDNELRFLIDELDARDDDDLVWGVVQDGGTASSGAKLMFVAGPHDKAVIPLDGPQVSVGRRPDCQFVVDDLQVSGIHFSVQAAGTGYTIVDPGSRNGTFVNGKRIGAQPVGLSPGDLIEFGSCVAEFKVSGGQAAAPGQTLFSSVIAQGAYELSAQPKFVINGHVENTPRIEIGRSPQCALRLESDQVSRVHCFIEWETDGFYVTDDSSYGTYVSDKRIVKEKLQTGHVLKVGIHLINVTVRGERCLLDEIDAATALANIEVQKLTQFNLKDAVLDHANIGGILPQAYKTVFKLDVPDADAMVRERKAKFKQGAPAWRPSTDIKSSGVVKVAVMSSVAAALAVCGLLYATSSDAALLNHPLSASHASKAFAARAEQAGLPGGCQSCHSVGAGVDQDKCTTCHEDFGGSVRQAHHEITGSACAACHTEHRGAPRTLASGAPSLLGAGDSCSAAQCHPNQHSEDFLRTGPPPPMVIEAGPVPSFDLPQAEFHARHAVVERNGEPLSIGCTACHATGDPAAGELQPAPSGLSCFRCHTGGEQHVKDQCLSCHATEHQGGVDLERMPEDDPMMAAAMTAPSIGGSLLRGGGLALAVFLPLLGLGLVLRARRRQMSQKLVEEMQAIPVEVVKRLIHSINKDKCVGCGMCVSACPGSVLELVNHKSVVVNFDSCIQCKKCEAACAFDALRMHDADKPPPMIQMPDLDSHYQTPVAGMYLIGQASGTPQVKNAANLGKAVIDHMLREGLAPGAGQRAGGQVDVIIVGSGPGGLSAALSCAQAGLSYVVLEKQRGFAWTIRSYYHKGKEVMAEPNDVAMVGLLPHWDTNREELLAAWEQKIQEHGVQVHYQQNVTDVKKQGELFTIACADSKGTPTATWTGARVVLAIGTMGNPRTLQCPGDDMEKVANALVDPDEFVGKNILVVGGTDSAIEVVLALCERNKVWMSMRRAKFERVKPANLERITKVIEAGKCTMVAPTVVKEVTADTVVLEYRDDKRVESIPNDAVFAMIGGHPPIKWLQQIGVPYADKPHSWSPPRTDDLAKGSL